MIDGTGGERRILSVRQVNEGIQGALQVAFPEPIWVKGEVQRLPHDAARRPHVYFELHESGPEGAAGFQIPAALLKWDRDRFGLGRYLDGSDPAFRLQDKLEVCLLCRVDFYPPFGKVSLKVVGVDPEFSLGKLEAQRRRVLAWLEAEGLLRLNAARPLADLPLRVGLITSHGSAADRDFRTGLAASGYAFGVMAVDCRMQGEQVAPQVTAALRRLGGQELDVIVITRGGGSRADLSWFDQPSLCEAVARCPLPVVTAIGHEIDTSLSDLCAHTRCKTPTAAAEFLAARVGSQDERLRQAARRLATLAERRLAAAARRLDTAARVAPAVLGRLRGADLRLQTLAAGLEGRTGRAVARHGRRLQTAAGRLVASIARRTAAARQETDYLAGRMIHAAPSLARWHHGRLDLLAEKVRLLDPGRLLERGFTLSLDRDGRPLRRAADVRPGQLLRTRFADGEVTSTVRGGRRRASEGGPDGHEEDPGQQALF
ncbi:MAG: exodeoxyribonuclease VII large subunit [Candidatus Krumholzibacteriia bacterium]